MFRSHDPYIGFGSTMNRSPNSANALSLAERMACRRRGKSWMLSPTHITTPAAAGHGGARGDGFEAQILEAVRRIRLAEHRVHNDGDALQVGARRVALRFIAVGDDHDAAPEVACAAA